MTSSPLSNHPPDGQRQPGARLLVALPLLWAALLLYLTLAPAVSLPPTPEWKLLSFDTFAHGAFFAVQATLTWLWARRQTRWSGLARHATRVVLLGCIAFGALIEVLQIVMPFHRDGEWSDLLSDSLGTAAALGLLVLAAGRLRRRGWAIMLLPVFFLPPSSGQSQDMPRARATIAKLASPGLHGRGYVRQGEHKAAAYLRGRLRQLGLQPLAPDYTQPFALDVNTFPGKLQLKLIDQPARELLVGRDFIAAPESAPCSKAWSNLVALDTLLFTDTAAVRRLLYPKVLNGKANGVKVTPAKLPKWPQVAGVIMRANDEARLSSLPLAVQEFFGAQKLRVILQPKLTASLASKQAAGPRLEVLAGSWPLPRYFEQVELHQTVAFEIDAQLQRHYLTQNLCAVLPGRTQPDSFLVVTAHYDHLGMMGKKTYFPGANDNASGVAMLLELAAHYARPENRPACSLAFLLFGAEEAGLVGSSYFVEHPLVPLRQIKFLLNLDLLGTGEDGATIVNGRVYEAAFRQLQQLNEAGHYLPSLAARGRAANSDHYPFSEAGVPAFFIYTRGGSKAYHDVHDTPDQLSLAGFAGAFGLLRDFINARQPAGRF